VIKPGTSIVIEPALNGFIVYEAPDPLNSNQLRARENLVFTELVGGEKALATWLESHFASKRQQFDPNAFSNHKPGSPRNYETPFQLIDDGK
jgi:hypothetical protein